MEDTRMIHQLDEKLPDEISELVCLKCLHRAIHVYPSSTLLKDLKCKCGEVGYLIKTGQTIEQQEQECNTCNHYINDKCKLGLCSDTELYCEFWQGRK